MSDKYFGIPVDQVQTATFSGTTEVCADCLVCGGPIPISMSELPYKICPACKNATLTLRRDLESRKVD